MHGSSNVAPAPRGRDHFVSVGQPIARRVVLYEGEGVIVTTEFFEADGHRFPVAELGQVERVELGGWLHGPLFELWTRIDGHRMRIFQCLDAREFGKVCRALTRARERAGLA